MNTVQQIAETIHDTVQEGANAAEDIHRLIAEFPLDMLATIKPLEAAVAEVRDIQARTIEGVYGLVRQINDRVSEIVIEAGESDRA